MAPHPSLATHEGSTETTEENAQMFSFFKIKVFFLVNNPSDYDEIIAKMTRFYKNQATSKKSHPAAAIGSKLS